MKYLSRKFLLGGLLLTGVLIVTNVALAGCYGTCTINIDINEIPPEISTNPTGTQAQISTNATSTVGAQYTQHITVNQDLWYAWNRWIGGGETTIEGYVDGLSNPDVTIGYDISVTNHANGQTISPGASVPTGTVIDFKFPEYNNHNISWFGTGYSADSPYGTWGSGNPGAISCNADDYIVHYIYDPASANLPFDVYVPLRIAPPARSLTGTNGLSCGAPVTSGAGAVTYTCTVTTPGALSPVFNYGATTGNFYYRYYDARNNQGYTAGCYGNNIPMTSGSISGFTFNPGQTAAWNNITTIYNGYTLQVGAMAINYNLTAVASNNNPNAPTITGPTTGFVNTSYSYGFTATDPDNDTIRYGIDWDGNGVVDQLLPASGYVNSGTQQATNFSWATPGTYTFKAQTQDSRGGVSGWTSYTVTISAQPAPVATITPTSATIVTGNSVTLTYTCANSTSGDINDGVTGNPITADGNAHTVSFSPTTNKTYTLSCSGPGGSTQAYSNVTVVPVLTASCSVSPTTAVTGANVTWTAVPSGGTGSYGYSWTATGGSPSTGSATSLVTNYGSTGTKTATVTVTSGAQNTTVGCSNSVVVSSPLPDLTSASASSGAATAGSPVTLSAVITNGGTAATGAGFTDLFQRANDAAGTGAIDVGTYASDALAISGSNTAFVSYTFPSAGTWYIRACADKASAAGTGTITESNENNNCSGNWTAVSVAAAPAPTAFFSPASQTINQGNSSIQSYRCQNSTSGNINGTGITADGNTYGFADNPFVNTTYTLTCTGPGGTAQATSIVNVNQPNLSAGVVSPTSATVGQPVTISSTVTNSGSGPTPPSATFPNIIQVSGGSIYPATTLINLGAGASAGVSASITFGAIGTYQVRACADNNSSFVGTITESNEGDNCSNYTTVTVTAAPAPNLTASTPTPTSAVVGQMVTLSSTISNTGNQSTGAPFTDLLQRADDAAGTVNVADSGTYANATLGAAGTNAATFSITPALVGTKYYRVCADKQSAAGTGVITESNEGDNCSAWTAVTTYPVLSATCSVSPTTAFTGGTVTWTAVPSGGTGAYTYSWTATGGSPSTGAAVTLATQYGTAGTKSASVTVTSGTQSNTFACSNSVVVSTPQPDLTASTPTPTTAVQGNQVTFSSTITNSGNTSTGAAFTDLFQKADDAAGTVNVTDMGTASSNALNGSGATSNASLLYTFPSADAGKTKYVRVCADKASAADTGTITESNEGNNCSAWTAITVTDQCAANTQQVTVTGSLFGTVWGSNPYTASSDMNTAAVHAGLIANGVSATIQETSVGIVNSFPGTKANGITTTTWGSPMCGVTISLISINKPDLTAGAVSPSTATAGSSAQFSATITNTAVNAGTGAGFTNLLQKAIDSSGTQSSDVGTVVASALGASGSAGVIINYAPPAGDAGTTKYFRICADKSSAGDVSGVISESDETNNCGAWTAVAIGSPAPPSVSCTPNSPTAAPNQNVIWTVVPANFSPAANSYSWTATGGTPASGSGVSTQFTTKYASGGSYAAAVTGTNGTNPAGPTSCTPVSITGPTYNCGGPVVPTIIASPSRIIAGNSATIMASSTGMLTGQTCTVTGPGGTLFTTPAADTSCNMTTASASTGVLNAQSTYTINCAGVTSKVIVNVVPKFKEF